MKILVLQLARLGDIYQSWPALRALRRAYPEAEIDLLVRPKFEGAVVGLEAISNCLYLPTEEIIEPLFGAAPDVSKSIKKLDQLLTGLKGKNFDRIINLSFSPVSSYIVHFLKGPKAEISGYTRHDDGFFDMAGEISTYFYAQVGPGRFNRFHLTDLMAGVAGVALWPEDWNPPNLPKINLELPDSYIVLHVGSSEAHKSLPAFRWNRILSFFQEQCPDTSVVLIGSKGEVALADLIVVGCRQVKIINLVGETAVSDIFSILGNSQLLVGCDSAPMHVASFTKTPCLNLSIGQVNFWETGPRSPRSFILRAAAVDQVISENVGILMKEIMDGQNPIGLIKYIPDNPCYLVEESEEQRFAWNLILAIYMGQPFPAVENLVFFQGCQKLYQINEVILENLEKVSATNLERLKPILDRGDEIVHKLSEMVPLLGIYANWLKAERARVRPGSLHETILATRQMHLTLKSLIRPYLLDEKGLGPGEVHG